MNALVQQLVNLSRRFPVVVASLVIFVVLVGANYWLWDRQKTLNLQHDEARHNGETVLQSLTTHQRILTELNTVKEALDQIDRNLIVESDLAENQGYFYQIEGATRIRLSQVSQLSSQPSPEGNPFKAIPFALRITGSYSQIITLLHELETGPRLLHVKTCNLARGDAKANNALTMDLVVEILASR
jgi:Tfp pilus assembly protein PilO